MDRIYWVSVYWVDIRTKTAAAAEEIRGALCLLIK